MSTPERLRDLPDDALDVLAEKIAARMQGIVPERVYPPDDAARLIGLTGDRAGRTIREFPDDVLPAVPVTPGGKGKGYYGRDLIRFIRERRPVNSPSLDDAA